MPSVLSLKQQQYYGNPQNFFWKLLGSALEEELERTYAQRVKILKSRKICLWDVVASCQRAGSLDSAIKKEQANPILTLLEKHPSIKAIAFNGKKSEQLFRKHHRAELSRLETTYTLIPLPSSSPAHASMPLNKKRNRWKRLANYLQ